MWVITDRSLFFPASSIFLYNIFSFSSLWIVCIHKKTGVEVHWELHLKQAGNWTSLSLHSWANPLQCVSYTRGDCFKTSNQDQFLVPSSNHPPTILEIAHSLDGLTHLALRSPWFGPFWPHIYPWLLSSSSRERTCEKSKIPSIRCYNHLNQISNLSFFLQGIWHPMSSQRCQASSSFIRHLAILMSSYWNASQWFPTLTEQCRPLCLWPVTRVALVCRRFAAIKYLAVTDVMPIMAVTCLGQAEIGRDESWWYVMNCYDIRHEIHLSPSQV